MAGYRIVRINDDIKRELAQLIPNLKDPRVRGLISITRVDTTPDLRYCKVYVSALDKGDVKDMVKGLKSASGYLRRELAKRMTLRYTPELIFTPDDSIDQGSRIIGILGDIEKEPPVGPSSDPAAHLPEAAGVICFSEFTGRYPGHIVHDLGSFTDKAEQARRVFDALREFDHEAVTEIYAQCPDASGLGLAIGNRLKKAAGFHIVEV